MHEDGFGGTVANAVGPAVCVNGDVPSDTEGLCQQGFGYHSIWCAGGVIKPAKPRSKVLFPDLHGVKGHDNTNTPYRPRQQCIQVSPGCAYSEPANHRATSSVCACLQKARLPVVSA